MHNVTNEKREDRWVTWTIVSVVLLGLTVWIGLTLKEYLPDRKIKNEIKLTLKPVAAVYFAPVEYVEIGGIEIKENRREAEAFVYGDRVCKKFLIHKTNTEVADNVWVPYDVEDC